jgi:hypothetical protein
VKIVVLLSVDFKSIDTTSAGRPRDTVANALGLV